MPPRVAYLSLLPIMMIQTKLTIGFVLVSLCAGCTQTAPTAQRTSKPIDAEMAQTIAEIKALPDQHSREAYMEQHMAEVGKVHSNPDAWRQIGDLMYRGKAKPVALDAGVKKGH